MCGEGADVFRKEFAEQRHDYSLIGVDGEECDCPSGAVGSADCDLVPFPDSDFPEETVELFYCCGKFPECEILALKIAESLGTPIVLDGALELFEIVDHKKSSIMNS